jgi:uncharacterized membrane protein
MNKHTITIISLLLATTVQAAPLQDFQFKSPSFNGNGYGTYVLTIQNEEYTRAQAIQQALEAAKQQAATAAQNTPLNQFLTNLESRVLAQVSQNLATAMFAGGSSTSGTFNFQGNTIYWQNTGGSITLNVTDTLGNVTTINVPLGQFNLTGSTP